MFQPTSSVQERLGRILVMNDAAHSLGAYYSRNQRTGCETDIAIFSLHAVKNVTTAEGGAICLNLPAPFDNAELYNGAPYDESELPDKRMLFQSRKPVVGVMTLWGWE